MCISSIVILPQRSTFDSTNFERQIEFSVDNIVEVLWNTVKAHIVGVGVTQRRDLATIVILIECIEWARDERVVLDDCRLIIAFNL